MTRRIVAGLLIRRLALGLRQVDIAATIGVSVQTVQAWEAAKKTPSLAHLETWCAALNANLELCDAEAVAA